MKFSVCFVIFLAFNQFTENVNGNYISKNVNDSNCDDCEKVKEDSDVVTYNFPEDVREDDHYQNPIFIQLMNDQLMSTVADIENNKDLQITTKDVIIQIKNGNYQLAANILKQLDEDALRNVIITIFNESYKNYETIIRFLNKVSIKTEKNRGYYFLFIELEKIGRKNSGAGITIAYYISLHKTEMDKYLNNISDNLPENLKQFPFEKEFKLKNKAYSNGYVSTMNYGDGEKLVIDLKPTLWKLTATDRMGLNFNIGYSGGNVVGQTNSGDGVYWNRRYVGVTKDLDVVMMKGEWRFDVDPRTGYYKIRNVFFDEIFFGSGYKRDGKNCVFTLMPGGTDNVAGSEDDEDTKWEIINAE